MTIRVALTGATGFVGRHLVSTLLAGGAQVRALCRHPEQAGLPQAVSVVPGNLEDQIALARLVEGADVVVHCAALIKAARQTDFERINVACTASLARVCANLPSPPRMIFLSSLAARHPELSHYAASKRKAEEALAQAGELLHWSVLRPPAVYGPGDKESLRLFKLLRYGLFPTPAPGNARLSLIYVSDLCDVIQTLLRASVDKGASFEVRDACEEGYTWGAIAGACSRYLGRRVVQMPVPLTIMRALATANQVSSRITGHVPRISPGKVRELFHEDWVCRDNALTRYTQWRPKVDLVEGIRRTLSWYESHDWL